MPPNNPTDLARETLKQLSLRQLLPTPENYSRIYAQVAGPEGDRPEKPHRLAELIGQAYGTLTPQTQSYRINLARLLRALEEENWEQVPQQLIDLAVLHYRERTLTDSWGNLILGLLKLWDLRLPELSQAYKQAALERLMITFGHQPELLNEKLSRLIADWGRGVRDDSVDETLPAALPAATGNGSHARWCTLLSLVLHHGIEPRLLHAPALVEPYQALLANLSQLADDAEAVSGWHDALRAFLIQLELHRQQDERVASGLTNLLQLLLQNIAELNRSDAYLLGQIESLQAILASPELSMQQVYQLEVSLKEVIRKQGELKSSLDEAASSLRGLLDTFLAQLAKMSDDTEQFHHKVSEYQDALRQSDAPTEIRRIAGALLGDTETMQQLLSHSREGLRLAQDKVEAAQQRISELERALENASAKVQEDQLTGTYNRRGLDEHFARELGRAERTGSPLSVALIDVDNFKQLNDRFGHLAGDRALRFLADAIRHNLRPSDICARFGGEEFVVLLPDTPIAEAQSVMHRLQRELTRTFFLTNNERLVITFSAGVALWHLGEKEADVIDRADRAMYQAKLAGKNRTCSAEPDAQLTC
ncbi:GGDEF domain-containing protein [Crenobacter caeni]|uniref:diguanylate cyclase n=1 Tax=Crenobacter caeni TaxID=2705474 RepID=A0A6B2KPM5_9NEIS|nr:GGDEF domain-containing protein [Crenobacter caeni]NDV12073.1 diguanylate cyclase [Crenobacter caeni]